MPATEIPTETVERAVSGDRAALEELLRTLEPELRARVKIQTLWQRSLSVDDVLQVSWLEAFLRVRHLREATPAGLRAWLYRVVENNLRDAIRALDRDKRPDARRRETRGSENESLCTLLHQVSEERPGAGTGLVLREDIERLREAIARLPKSYRLVVERMDIEERGVGEVAEELGRSRGAVHLLRSRARDRLTELMARPACQAGDRGV